MRPLLLGMLLSVVAVVALAAAPLRQDVTSLFRAGRWADAREAAQATRDGGLVPFLLVQDPQSALQAARAGQRAGSEGERLRLSLEGAWIEFSRARYAETLQWLEPLLARGRDLPGEVHLLAGMAYRAQGLNQRAREELAAVKPTDPAFAWARYDLGSIALEAGDDALALRYFESADRSPLAGRMPLLLVGRWQALQRTGQQAQAEALAARIEHDYPGSVAAMTVSEAVSEPAVRAPGPPPVSIAPEQPDEQAPPPAATGRYALQLAAFGDRGRALAYLARWQEKLPDLQLVEDEAEGGRVLYRIRLGPFATRAEAQAAADRLRRAHGLEVIVTEAR